jgi:hypothetical protein
MIVAVMIMAENVRSTAHLRCNTTKVVCPASFAAICTARRSWAAALTSRFNYSRAGEVDPAGARTEPSGAAADLATGAISSPFISS